MSWESNINTSPLQKHLYNGKELDSDFGLNLYFYGARLHDPALGRFTTIDPVADNFAFVSVYNYAENRVPNGIDLHGLQFHQSPYLWATNPEAARKNAEAHQKGRVILGNVILEGLKTPFYLLSGLSNDEASANARRLGDIERAEELAQDARNDYANFTFDASVGGFFGKVFSSLKGVTRGTTKSLDDVVGLDKLDDRGLAAIKGRGRFRKGRVGEFRYGHPIEDIENSHTYINNIKNLTDEELIKTFEPGSSIWGTITVKRGVIYRGNNRIYEAERRGLKVEFEYEHLPDDNAQYFYDY